MARLNLSALIPAPPEDVYQYVTGYGKDGPLPDSFQAQYGKLVSNNDNVYVTEELEDSDEEGEESGEKITWNTTFEYPSRRVMEAVDSSWANRVDLFRPVRNGTRWTISWDPRVGGIRGVAQYVAFRLAVHRRFRRSVIDPVRAHFDGSRR